MTYEGDDKKLHPIRTISHCRVVQNSELKGDNYGKIWVYIWNDRHVARGDRFHIRNYLLKQNSKTNGYPKRKRNSRRELKRTIIVCSKTLSDRGVV